VATILYLGEDVDAATAFYPTHLGFTARPSRLASGGWNLAQLVELFQQVGAA